MYCREGCMLLYGPKPATTGGARSLKGGGNPVPSYEIAVHSSKYTSQSLSLFRTSDKGNCILSPKQIWINKYKKINEKRTTILLSCFIFR